MCRDAEFVSSAAPHLGLVNSICDTGISSTILNIHNEHTFPAELNRAIVHFIRIGVGERLEERTCEKDVRGEGKSHNFSVCRLLN